MGKRTRKPSGSFMYTPRVTCGRTLDGGEEYPCELAPEHVTRGEDHRNGCLTWNLSKDESVKRWRDVVA